MTLSQLQFLKTNKIAHWERLVTIFGNGFQTQKNSTLESHALWMNTIQPEHRQLNSIDWKTVLIKLLCQVNWHQHKIFTFQETTTLTMTDLNSELLVLIQNWTWTKKRLNAWISTDLRSCQVQRIAGQRLLEPSKLSKEMVNMIFLPNTCGFHKKWSNATKEMDLIDLLMRIADCKGNKPNVLPKEERTLSSKQIRSAYRSLDTSSKAETIQLSQSEQIDRYHLAKVER